MTRRKPPEEHLKRGPKPKVKADFGRRGRARSPYLPTSDEEWQAVPPEQRVRLLAALRDIPDTSDSATEIVTTQDLPVVVRGVRTELTEEQISGALALLSTLAEKGINRYAKNSRRGMHADWRHWLAFCARENRVAMPVSFDDLSTFVDGLIGAGYARASIEHILFTLKASSEIWGCPSPVDTLPWRSFWRDRCREKLSKRQHQAMSMNVADLDRIAEASSAEDPRAVRDLAFAAVSHDLLARASEVVAMKWEDIYFGGPDGSATYMMPRSKTDQEGKGTETYLSPETVELILRWAEHRFAENPYLFHALPRYDGQKLDRKRPLAIREVSRIYDRIARRAGVEKALSGHSARVGATQDLTLAGVTLPEIMQAGRWKSTQMPARYAAKASATLAGQARNEKLRALRAKKD